VQEYDMWVADAPDPSRTTLTKHAHPASEANLTTRTNAPRPPDAPALRAAVDAAFSAGGVLARAVEGYEPRAGQRAMAERVAAVLETGGVLLVEAGTGTGKTLAYLIPAILSGNRVLVSTGTKNLQEQIFFKDLPALKQALGVPFTATLMKGRSNYLCLHRFEQYRASPAQDVFLLPMLEEWADRTETGDRAELRDLPEDLPAWKEVAADAETCLGTECPRYDDCFVTRMRQRAAESDVVIVNHHLLCADASVRQSAYGEVIPGCGNLVVDEAHQLEDVATQYFGVAVSSYRLDDLVRDGERLVGGGRLTPTQADEIRRGLERIATHARTFFSRLAQAGQPWGGGPAARAVEGDASGRPASWGHGPTNRPGSAGTSVPATPASAESRTRYTSDTIADHYQDGLALVGALDGFEAALALIVRAKPAAGEVVDKHEDAEALIRRAGELRDELRFLLRASDADFVYYVEFRPRAVFLRASPIDVSRIVQKALFDDKRTTILTSATLAVDGSFDYVRGRLGIAAADQLRVPSEFDFARQAILYLPRRMPPPRAVNFGEAAAREVLEILKRTRGRAFVLFTSYSVLRVVQQFVEMTLPYPVLVQGKAPRSVLIEDFRRTPNAVLLATSSFWQGVDVVGEALSCVIIDKLPFASPADPVTAARIESIGARGGNAFADYQIPLAILTLQQGLGRLIRHRTDRGVLAILDPRLRTMGYGRRFLESLPPAPVTTDIREIERFLDAAGRP
jgi:ATP-dependent DNA helicase DinG